MFILSFPLRCRWACLRGQINDIDDAVKTLCEDRLVKYQSHVGGGHYISVTSGYKCVDFRKFYVPYGQAEVKPTKKGIALRLREWDEMKRVVDAINDAFPALATALPCYMEGDHANQMSALQCSECYPFLDTSSI